MWQRFFSRSAGARRSASKRRNKIQVAKLANFESLEQRQLLTATPTGGEFLVSEEFQPSQRIVPEVSSVAIDDAGASVVAYHGRGVSGSRLAGDDREIFIERFTAEGDSAGAPTVANAVARGDQFDPSVEAAADGTFWVAWSGRGAGDRHGVFAQRFAADGSTIGDATLVNSTVGGAQMRPDVAAGDDGSAVIVWSGVGTAPGESDFDGIFMRRIDASGSLVGEEALVNSTTAGQQDHPAVAMGDSGEFVVTWSSRNEDGSDWGVFAQQFNADGTTKGAQISVNATTAGSQFGSDVGVAADDTFVIAWNSFAQDGDSWGVFAQRFTSGGAIDGSEQQINDTTTGHQQDVAVAVADAGEFIVVWSHGEPNGDGWETHGRTFNEEGDPEEDSFGVNQESTGSDSGHQRLPAVDMNNVGESVVIFRGNGVADHHGVFGQRYQVDVGPVENVDPRFISVDGETVLSNITIDANVGVEVTVRIVAEDDNRRDTLSYRFDQSPDGADIIRIDNNTIDVTWTPSVDELGSAVPFRVIVEDDGEPVGADAVQFFVDVQNQAPVIDLNGADDPTTGFAAQLEMEETQVAAVDADLSITDAEATGLVSATAVLTGVSSRSDESLIIDPLDTSIEADYDVDSSVLTLTGEDTLENYERVLRTLAYENLATDRTVGGLREILITVNDGDDDSNRATSRIAVVGINESPELAVIEDVTLLAGSPLHIPLIATDADGDALTFEATVEGDAEISRFIPEGNRSARITVSSTDPGFTGGEMVFQLFEGRASRATERIIQLAEDGFYDGIIFHRVDDGFVIQAGDPDGTGSGGSTLGNFDDQFHPDLQHNRSGVLSMAKRNDDTNDSQFFITEGPARHLDSNHTIFGQLITGEEVREEISNVDVTNAPALPTDPPGDKPLVDIVIDSFEIFVDEQNGVLMLSAPEGTTGTATITVTVSDGNGGTSVRTFDVTVEPDLNDSPPFLEDIDTLTMRTDTTATFQLSAIDPDGGDDIIFLDDDQLSPNELLQANTAPGDLLYFVDPNTGVLTVIASNGLTGTHQFTVGVVRGADRMPRPGRPIDLQVVEIEITTGPDPT